MYDPAVARWWAVDILAEKYLRHNPYNYVMNNPTGFIDPSGMHHAVYHWRTERYEEDGVADKVHDKSNYVRDAIISESFEKSAKNFQTGANGLTW